MKAVIGRQRHTVLLANWMASVSDIKPVASVSAAVHLIVPAEGESAKCTKEECKGDKARNSPGYNSSRSRQHAGCGPGKNCGACATRDYYEPREEVRTSFGDDDDSPEVVWRWTATTDLAYLTRATERKKDQR